MSHISNNDIYMAKNGTSQCKIGTAKTKALAKALEASYPVNQHTILSKIESFQTFYDKDPTYEPSVAEMKAFLDLQASKGDLVIPRSQITNLRKQELEGTVALQRIKDTTYLATKSGMFVKILPNYSMVIINPSDTSEEGIALYQAFDTFFSTTNEEDLEEDAIKWGKTSNNGYEVSTKGDKRFSPLVATFKPGTVIDGVDVGGRTIENVYQTIIKKSRKGQAPAKDSKLNIDRTLPSGEPTWIGDGTKNFLPNNLWDKLYDLYTTGAEVGVPTPDITKEDKEDFSYYVGYLPLWQEWAKQNPELIKELRKKAKGKTLTDINADTRVSQARALANILNSPRVKRLEIESTNTNIQTSSTIEIPGVELKEDTEKSYLSRTKQNAEWSDITIALGEDLTTTGELQTAKFAGAEVEEVEKTNSQGAKYTTVSKITNAKKGKYVGIDLKVYPSAETIVTAIYNQIVERGLPTEKLKLNIAGNGIYNLKSNQKSYDDLLVKVLKGLQDMGISISEVRSGGQTGIDEAGIKAAMSLGIKASILAPKGYRFRNKEGKDTSNKEAFIKRFNSKYTDTKESPKRKVIVVQDTEEITKAKQKAKEYSIISSSQLGANSAWKIASENYGIEAIQMSNVDTYDDLSADEKAALELPYHQAMTALKRNEIKLTNASANKSTLRAGKLGRLLYNQVKNSDGVFIISELVDSKAAAHSFVEGKQGTVNMAKFAVAAGSLNSIATYHAMQMEKPLHVYDEFRDSWMTYDYKTNQWVKEDTPVLTKKALTFGREGSKEGRGFNETLGEKNWKAIRNVMHKTFGWKVQYYIDKSSKFLTDADMNQLWQETKKQAEKYTADLSNVSIDKTNAIAKLMQAMSPMERFHRTQYLAREFSSIIDYFIEKDKQDIKNRVSTARSKVDIDSLTEEEKETWQKILESEEKYQKILTSKDESKIRKAVIQKHGLTNSDNLTDKNFGILDELKKRIQDKIDNSEDITNRTKWQAVLDNFDALMTDAFDAIQYIENFRLIPYTKKNSIQPEASLTTDSETIQNDTDALVDDEGNNMEGNAGWSFKIRFVDPKQSLSQITKRALHTIEDRDINGKFKTDDLGISTYVNGEYAHTILINELSKMIDADDFCRQVQSKDGSIKFEFPALEKLVVKYPWVKGLINKLRRNNQLVGAFFHDFNKAFIKYYSSDTSGKPLPLNSEVAEESAYNSLKTNYEGGILLTNYSIYNQGGLVKENAKYLLTKLNLLNTQLNGLAEDKVYIDSQEAKGKDKQVKEQKESLITNLGTVSKDLAFILKSMGFTIDENYLRNNLYLLLTKDDKGVILYTKLATNIATILTAISEDEEGRSKNKTNEDDNYLLNFQSQLKSICKIVGQVSESDNIQSFRDGTKTRYSYSAVNYAINMVKKIKSDARRAEYIKNEFQYDEWFFYNGEWQNYWLEVLSGDDSTSRYLRDHLELSEVISMQIGKNQDPIPYADWDEFQTYRVMLGQFFSRASGDEGIQLANYNFPIFSDSPTSMYITMRRFVDNAKEGTFKEQLLPHLIKVVKQEMRRIKLVNDRERARKDDSVTDKAALEKIKCFDTKGNKFHFFPELNTLVDSETGMTFKQAAIKYSEEGRVDALDELIARTLAGPINPSSGQRTGGLLDKHFLEFRQQLNLDGKDLARMLDDLGGITYLDDSYVNQYAKDNNVSRGEAERIIEARNTQNAINALENYYWNSVFATSQIVQLTTTDLAYYKNATDFFKRFKEVYASGNRLNTNTKYGRKIENTVYLSDHIVTASKYTLVKTSLENAVSSGRMNEDEKNTILAQLKNINATDAQAFRNPFAFRAILDMIGAWSDEMEESFNNIINNTYRAGDIAVIWQTIKPFMFTNVPTDNGLGGRMRVPHQHKNSEYLSLAFYNLIALSAANNMTLKESSWLKGLGKFFNEHPEIDVVQFESAVKAGGQGIIDLSYDETTVNRALFNEDGTTSYYYNRAKEVVTRKALKNNKDPKKEFNKLSNMEILKIGLDDMLDTGEISQDKYNAIIEATELTTSEFYEALNSLVADPNTKQLAISNAYMGGTFNHQIVHQVSYEDYMIAQPNPPHFMDQKDATSGSQFRNLILANLPADFKTTVTIKRGLKNVTATLNREQIRNLYRGAIVNNLLDSFGQLKDSVFSNIHALQKKLLSEVQNNPKYGTDIIDALQIITVEDPLNPGQTMEVFNLPFDLPTISNQIQELLLSVFKNHVTKQTINGGSFVMVANVGLTKKLEVKRNENGTIKYAECMLPAWSEKFFKYYMSKDKKGNRFLDISKVPEDLKRMIGYRIPTENKYSMLPLRVVGFLPVEQGGAIMLPADITLIAGSDFDVDKMFLRIPAFEEVTDENGVKSLQKIEYDLEQLPVGEEWKATSKGKMTKEQRDNMMIDIEYAILTSIEGSEQVYKPGNFDIVKKWGKVSRIIDNASLRKKFITTYGHLIGLNTNDAEIVQANDNAKTILQIMHHQTINENGSLEDTITLEELQDFLDDGQTINPLLPQTYVYMHTQNMVGASLIGVYANGSSIHSKMQETNLKIADEYSFSIAGFNSGFRKIQSLHDQTTTIRGRVVYIQELIAQLQAASVDNAKDPTLADLYQSMKTAGLAVTMTRAGIDLEELAYFFGVIKTANNLGLSPTKKAVDHLFIHLTEVFDRKPDDLHVTVEEIVNTNIYLQKYPDLIADFLSSELIEKEAYSEKYNLTNDEINNILQAVYNTYSVITNLRYLHSAIKPTNDIMQCDSTNHALSVSIPMALLQKFEVERVNTMMSSKKFPFTSDEDTPIVDDFIMNKVITNSQTREEMESILMSRNLPHIQAFYSLGIELPLDLMRNYLIQGNADLQENLFSLLRDAPPSQFGMSVGGNYGGSRLVNAYFREYLQYILSNTEEFGDSENESFDVKRMYYLEKFAEDFIKLKQKAKNADSKTLTPLQRAFLYNSTLSRITITRPSGENANQVPQLILPRSGKLTPLMKASIRRDLDMLLYNDDPEVVKLGINLFMYSFYNNGFNYGPNSFGSYFDSIYWNALPRVIELLRTFKHNNTNIKTSLENFTEMFIANHTDDITDSLLITYNREWPMDVHEDGTITVRRGKVYSPISRGSRKYIRVPDAASEEAFIPYKLVSDSYEQNTATYKPMPVFDDPKPVYNAKSDAKKMMDIYFNNRKAKIQARLKAQKQEKEQKKQKNFTLNATNTNNTKGIDEAMEQQDAARMQSATSIEQQLEQAPIVKISSLEQALNSDAEISDDGISIAEQLLADQEAFEARINKDAPFIEEAIETITALPQMPSEEQLQKAQTITNEAEEALENINRCFPKI